MEYSQGVTAKPSLIIDIEIRDILRVLIAGAALGLLVWGLTWLLNQFVFSPIMCHNDGIKCSQSGGYSLVSSELITAIVGLIALIHLRAYRPLLVVLAAGLALWNIGAIFTGWIAVIASILLFAIAYALFTLVARFRSLLLAVIVMLVLIVIVRLAIVS